MMLNLFSIFDPTSLNLKYFNISLNWISLAIPMLIFPHSYWLIPSRQNMFIFNILMKMFHEFNNLSNKKMNSNLIIFITIMIMYMISNLLSLWPHTFTPSSHMAINLSLSLTLWMSCMINGWVNYSKKMFIHLLPMNTPSFLMVFMILIETISNLIRPWTLAIRLSANMLAGHLLLSLLGTSLENMPLMFLILIILQNLLMMLELAVSIIQAYVFSILSLLYYNEIN